MTARYPTTALIALMVLSAALATAAPIDNPADPPGKRQALTLSETWRAGGDDDEVFFGSIGRILAGPDGTVLVLDNQLSQVQVYAADGTWQQTLGREGDGPGEVRGPADAFYLPVGRLCLAQSCPGRLVYLNPDGTPGGQSHYQPLGDPATVYVAVSGLAAPDGLLLAGIRFNQSGGPEAQQTFFLSLCDAEGQEQVVYLDKQYAINYADFRLDEASMDFVWVGRMALDRDGRVYTAPDRNRYLVQVQDPDGTVVRQFTRPVKAPQRTSEEREIATKIHEGIGANYGGIPLQGVSIEDTDPAIAGLVVRPDGEVWVQSPANEAPDGTFAIFDVFDAEGHYTHQQVIEAPGDPDRDGLYLLSDGRVVIVVGGLDAWLSQQGIEGTSDDAPVLEIICYKAI